MLGKILITILIFVFGVFLFSPIQTAIANMNYTGPLKPVVEAFPIIFLVSITAFPVIFLTKGDKK